MLNVSTILLYLKPVAVIPFLILLGDLSNVYSEAHQEENSNTAAFGGLDYFLTLHRFKPFCCAEAVEVKEAFFNLF